MDENKEDNKKVEKPRLKDIPAHAKNPCPLSDIVLKEVKPKSFEFETVNTDTGETYLSRPFIKGSQVVKDERIYVKLFKESILSIGDMSIPALKLFTYVAHNLVKDKDYVRIEVMEFLQAFGYSKSENTGRINTTNYYRGLMELIEKGILFRKLGDDNVFWINADVMFNGKREGLHNDRVNDAAKILPSKPFDE